VGQGGTACGKVLTRGETCPPRSRCEPRALVHLPLEIHDAVLVHARRTRPVGLFAVPDPLVQRRGLRSVNRAPGAVALRWRRGQRRVGVNRRLVLGEELVGLFI
jgi:hypothetical protein